MAVPAASRTVMLLLLFLHGALRIALAVRPVMDEDVISPDNATVADESVSALQLEEGDRSKSRSTTSQWGKCLFMTTSRSENEKSGEDGYLSNVGVKFLEDRVAALSGEPLQLLRGVQEVWYAPTVASMHTAIATVAQAWSSQHMTVPLPRFLLIGPLQPMTPLAKFRSGTLELDLQIHASYLSKKWLGSEKQRAFKDIVAQMASDFTSWQAGQRGANFPPPTSALTVFKYQHLLKYELSQSEGTVLMVADRILGTWMFMPAIPLTEPNKGSEDAPNNLQMMCRRKVQSLNFAALVLAEWDVSERGNNVFENKNLPGRTVPYFGDIQISSEELGHSRTKQLMRTQAITVPFDVKGFIANELGAFLLPHDSHWWSGYFVMSKKFSTGTESSEWKDRIVSISTGLIPVQEKSLSDIDEPSAKRSRAWHRWQSYISWSTPFFDEVLEVDEITQYMVEWIQDSQWGLRLRLSGRGQQWTLRCPAWQSQPERYLEIFVNNLHKAQQTTLSSGQTGPEFEYWTLDM
mmetsp:Transcript_60093/g.143197  ORF Transcript_60093/g.143197 Transcript_60093/m.143197 type:complete len:520 (+) Transcript_60093:77-1636(+)